MNEIARERFHAVWALAERDGENGRLVGCGFNKKSPFAGAGEGGAGSKIVKCKKNAESLIDKQNKMWYNGTPYCGSMPI